MSGFLLPAALLVLLAVAFAVSALWQKSRGLAVAIAIGLPLAAAGLYAWRGTPAALGVAPAPIATEPAATTPGDAQADVDALIAELEAKLAAEPGHWEGWALLGRVRMEQGRFGDAREALAKAHALVPDDNAVAVAYAEALLRASDDRRFPPEAVALLERAARADPPDERGVFFLGMHLMLNDKPGEAADLWESLLPRLDESARAALAPQIAAARAAAGKQPVTQEGTGPAIQVTVALAPALAARAKAGAVLYVFARNPEGGPPVAVERLVPGAWPVQVTLSDADAAMPTAKLSGLKNVAITARLSMDGDALAQAGDLEAAPVTVATDGAAPVALHLDRVRP